jgi:hypothetical protein
MVRTTTSPEFSPTRILTTAACERRVPRRALPSGARRAGRRVLHAGCVEGRPPAPLVVARELKVEAWCAMPKAMRPMPDQESSQRLLFLQL